MPQIHELSSASTITSGNTLAMDTGTVTQKIDYNVLAKCIIEQYASSSLGGSAQSVKTALDAVISKQWTVFSNTSTLTSQADALANNSVYFGYCDAYGHVSDTDVPVNSNYYIQVDRRNASYITMFIVSVSNPANHQYVREKNNGTWGEWVKQPTRAEMDATFATYGCKNLLRSNRGDASISGITYTQNADGSIHVKGTATATSYYNIINWLALSTTPLSAVAGQRVTVSGGSSNVRLTLAVRASSSATAAEAYDTGNGASLTLPSDTTYQTYCALRVTSGTTVDEVIYPMVRLASIYDNAFVPYAPSNAELAPLVNQSWHVFSNTELLTTQVNALPIGAHYFGSISAYGHQSETGLPVNSACVVEVYVHNASYRTVRIISLHVNNREFTAVRAGGDWSGWYEVTKTAV